MNTGTLTILSVRAAPSPKKRRNIKAIEKSNYNSVNGIFEGMMK